MDFSNRSEHTNHTAQSRPAPAAPASSGGGSRRSLKSWRWLRVVSVVLLISVAVLVLALTASIAFTSSGKSQSKYVNNKELQAVFLNGGQVYFGNITALNSQYLTLSNIYYLRVNQTVQPNSNSSSSNDVSLVKLGCELHGPEDQMVINQQQVIFWENLKSSGQVAKAVQTFQQQNPNGQNCSSTTSAPASSSSSTSGTSSTTKK